MLSFDVDASQLYALIDELEPTEKQIKLAFGRALTRTAATLRKLSGTGLKTELDLRVVNLLRQRLKTLKLRSTGDLQEIRLWYGISGMPVSWFRGTPKAVKGTGDLTYRGETFTDGFVGTSTVKGRKTIFKRQGKGRLPIAEQLLPIRDKAEVFIEDRVFDQLDSIFWNHFRRDLRARVRLKLGER